MKFRISRIIARVIAISIVCIYFFSLFTYSAEEVPVAIYTGTQNAKSMYYNLKYQDIQELDESSKEAIYEMGSLDLMKGYGSRIFGPSNTLTVQEALSLIYNMVGREDDAQQAAQALDLARSLDKRLYPATKMWSDGYIQLALNDGLIALGDYNDAIRKNQLDLGPDDFHRNASVSRQDFAVYISKILDIQPINQQTKLFNSFKDWMEANPHNVPYLEAIVQNRIMTSSNEGYFYPNGKVTREQAAQIIKNAENLFFPNLGYQKKTGVIENIISENNTVSEDIIDSVVISIRNNEGKLEQIRATRNLDENYVHNNELTGDIEKNTSGEVLVYDNGTLGFSELIQKDEVISYIVNNENEVPFINVISKENVEYMVGTINVLDHTSNNIGISPYITLQSSDISNISADAVFNNGKNAQAIMPYSSNVIVLKDMIQKSVLDIQKGEDVLITVSNGVATNIETVDLYYIEEKGVISGIVEENNSNLGYITLYFKDGAGSSPEYYEQMVQLRTYNYVNSRALEIYKNQKPVSIDMILPGDSVYLKLDDSNRITKISAVDNLYPVYGKVKSNGSSYIVLQNDNGVYQHLGVSPNIPVIKNKRLVDYSEIQPGDYVKMLIQRTPEYTFVQEITIEAGYELITGIYKGNIAYYDEISEKIIVSNLIEFKNGEWMDSTVKGTSNLTLADDYNFNLPRYIAGEAYFAVKEDYTGTEKVVKMFFKKAGELEVVLNDDIVGAYPSTGEIKLMNDNHFIRYSDDSIIIRNGRLVATNNLGLGDQTYIVADRSSLSANYQAGVILVDDKISLDLDIYRGRISAIDTGKEITVESFSKLTGTSWEFTNTPKTFIMNPTQTFIMDQNGIVNIREFTDDFDKPYVNEAVYILSDGINALAVSTAPYGEVQIKGRILDISGGTTDNYGNTVVKPNIINLKNVQVYDVQSYLWSKEEDMELTIPDNALFVEGDQMLDIEDLEAGDNIRVIRSENSKSGEGYIFIVEN